MIVIAAMRKAGGDALDIIIENHSNTDTISAIQIGQALEELRIFLLRRTMSSIKCKVYARDTQSC